MMTRKNKQAAKLGQRFSKTEPMDFYRVGNFTKVADDQYTISVEFMRHNVSAEILLPKNKDVQYYDRDYGRVHPYVVISADCNRVEEFIPRYTNPTSQLPPGQREILQWELDKYCYEETQANPESCPNNIVWTAICKYMLELESI